MRERAAKNGRMQHAIAVQIVDVFTSPAQQAQVLDPLYGFADKVHLR